MKCRKSIRTRRKPRELVVAASIYVRPYGSQPWTACSDSNAETGIVGSAAPALFSLKATLETVKG